MHVDDLLAAMGTEEFDERMAHYLLSPWDRPYEVGAMVAAMVHNVMQGYASAKAGKTAPRSAMIDPMDLVPRPMWAKVDEQTDGELAAGSVEQLAKNLGCV